jgi:hypothetical protein
MQYFCSTTPETSIDNTGLADVCNCEYRDAMFAFGVIIPVSVKSSASQVIS